MALPLKLKRNLWNKNNVEKTSRIEFSPEINQQFKFIFFRKITFQNEVFNFYRIFFFVKIIEEMKQSFWRVNEFVPVYSFKFLYSFRRFKIAAACQCGVYDFLGNCSFIPYIIGNGNDSILCPIEFLPEESNSSTILEGFIFVEKCINFFLQW